METYLIQFSHLFNEAIYDKKTRKYIQYSLVVNISNYIKMSFKSNGKIVDKLSTDF